MLTNKRYIGYYIYADYEVENGIPAIIDKELFEKVQVRMKENGSCPARGTGNVDFLLAGKLFCGHCGAAMQGDSGTGRHGVVYYYYTCGESKRNGSCKKKSIKKDYIENIIVKEAIALLTDENIQHLADVTIKGAESENNKNTRIPDLEYKLKDVRTAINNVMKAVEKGIASDTMLHRIEELEAEAKDYERQLAIEKASKIDITKEMVIRWLEKFRNGDPNDEVWRHRIIDLLINSVTLWDDPDGSYKITIAYNLASMPDKIYRIPSDSGSSMSIQSPPNNCNPNLFPVRDRDSDFFILDGVFMDLGALTLAIIIGLLATILFAVVIGYLYEKRKFEHSVYHQQTKNSFSAILADKGKTGNMDLLTAWSN